MPNPIITKVTGSAYRVKTGSSGNNDLYDEVSLWTDSTDVTFPDGKNLKNKIYDYASGTLVAGQTSLTITSALITENGMLDIYVPNAFCKVTPNTISQSNGTVTLTFPAQSSNMEVRVRCT